jgi:diguanylate cyclase (GGDEF)-like protein
MLAAVGDLLFGSDTVGRRALMRWALTAQCYAVALFLLFVGVQRGMASLAQAQFVALYCTLGILAFYVALRARWFASSRDPTLTFPMALFSISAIVLSYSLTELSRSASLQLLFLLVVFEMPRLTQRQTNVITFGATGMLMASLVFMTIRAAPGFDLHNEIFNVAMAGVMLPVLSMVAREVRQLRRRQVEQRADLQNTLTRLSELSIRDPLTGLYNRRHLLTILEDEAKRQRRSGHVFSLAVVNLDLFKGINDNFGHLVGDAVLREFAKVATEVLPTTDAIGRWGGPEFVLMLYHTDAEPAMLAMDRLRQAVAKHDWGALAPGLHVSFSAGVCQHQAGMEITHTLELADRALSAAKAAGRHRCVLASEAFNAPARDSDCVLATLP